MKVNNHTCLIFVAIVLLHFVLNTTFAVIPLTSFQRYSISDGISQGRINCIVQDNDGLMWFGTDNALNKFDGYEFTIYEQKPDDSTQLHGQVKTLFVDSKNRLWIGCGYDGGLYFYNKEKDNFRCFLDNPVKRNSKNEFFNIYSIVEDESGYLWVGTTNGLFKFEADIPDSTRYFAHDSSNIYSLSNNKIISLYYSKSGQKLWIGHQRGIDAYLPTQNKFYNILNSKPVHSIFELSAHNVIFGTRGDGMGIISLKNDSIDNLKDIDIEFFKHDPSNKNSLSSDFISHITIDKDINFWISTDNGLNYLQNFNTNDTPMRFSFQHLLYDPQDDESLNYNFIKCAYFDDSHVLWVGTNTGLNKSKNYKFHHYRQQNTDDGLLSNKVQAIFEDSRGKLWIGTSKGVSLFNKKTGFSTPHLPQFEAVLGICEDNQRNIWLATWKNGLIEYNPTSAAYKQHLYKENDTKTPHSRNMNLVFADSKGNIWACAWTKGVDFFSREEKSFDLLIQSKHMKYVTCFFEDSKGNIWIGSLDALCKVTNPKEGSIKTYRSYVTENKAYKSNYNINCISEDKFNRIWIGAKSGLYLLMPNDTIFIRYSKEDGLPSDNILGILPDENGDFWVSYANGLSKITTPGTPLNEKQNLYIRNYSKHHGLRSGEFVANSYHRCRSGEMIFGGTNGFNMFHPNDIKDNNKAPQVIFTDFLLFNKHISMGEKINGEIILPKPIHSTKKIILDHTANFFSFRFAALHFASPEQNKYSYKMEGFDKSWNDLGNEQKVSFIGLKPGAYKFRVKAANSDGLWNNASTDIEIVILPPWWQTLWFRIASFAGLAFALLMIVRLRTYNLKRQKQKLEKMVQVRTSELNESNKKLEQRQQILEQKSLQISEMSQQLHEADQTKLRFFTNISHEFRTPLTLIISPLEKLLQQGPQNDWNKSNMTTHLQLMHRNAKRLLRLLNQILDFRKLTQKAKILDVTNNDIIKFIEEIVKTFSGYAETKDIHLTLNIEHLSKNMNHLSLNKNQDTMQNDKCKMNNDKWSMINDFWFDPDIMEKILYNLISNAIKYTPEGGEILIDIDIVGVETRCIASLQNTQLTIKISDTGIGIKPENLTKIFDRFYTVETLPRHGRDLRHATSLQTGIGLTYTKELVEFHKGTIKAESEYGKGATFILHFPFGLAPLGEVKNIDNVNNLNYTKSMIEMQDIIDNPVGKASGTPLPSQNNEESNINNSGGSPLQTLLLVEDNDDMRLFIFNELRFEYQVLTASNGLEGLEFAIKEMPDFILSDIMMPVMDGTEMCKQLKEHENTSHIPIILLTAKSGEENIINGLETGADDYVCKPFNIDILKLKIKNLLEIRSQLKEKYSKSLDIKPTELSGNKIDEKFLNKAIELVEQNISEPEFLAERFIKEIGYGRAIVYKKMKALTNQSVSEFIRTIRLKKAAKLLLTEEKSTIEIANMVGFNYRESFHRSFTAMFGKTPSQFVKEHKNA